MRTKIAERKSMKHKEKQVVGNDFATFNRGTCLTFSTKFDNYVLLSHSFQNNHCTCKELDKCDKLHKGTRRVV